jgi:hypothetical protein
MVFAVNLCPVKMLLNFLDLSLVGATDLIVLHTAIYVQLELVLAYV